MPAREAKVEVKAFIDMVRRQGSLGFDVLFTEKDFRFDLRIEAARAARVQNSEQK